MADSFADLWSSSAPTKQAQPRTLGALSSQTSQNVRKPANDVFAMLASAGSTSSVNSRSSTPSHIGRTQTPPSNASVAKPLQKSTSGGSDAFSNLLSPSFASTSRNGANMTMAQRAAQAERQRTEQLQKANGAHRTQSQNSSAWEGLDSLGSSAKPQAQQVPEDDWMSAFTAPTTTKPAPNNAPKTAQKPIQDDDWGLNDFVSSPPARPQSSTQNPSKSLFDLDPFSPSASDSNNAQSKRPISRSDSPGDFDFGDKEDGLLNEQSDNDDDDILGDLGKPVDQVKPPPKSPSPRPPPDRQSVSPAQSADRPSSRAVSPPPHIVGQIVEMGFSPQQARIALAATDTGLDVQAALENLLSNGVGSATPPVIQDGPRRPDRRQPQRQDTGSDQDAPSNSRRPPRRVDSIHRETPPPSDSQRNIQEQADKLLAQASEIGLSMFNRANAFWKEGKEKVQKAYEERAAAAASTRNTPLQGSSSRPRWLQDGSEHDDEDALHHSGSFRDDDDDHDEVLPPRPNPQPRRDADARSKPPPQVRESRQQPAPEASRVGNLLSDDSPTVYVSPFRRKAPSRSQSQSTVPQSAPQKAIPTPVRAPSPIPLIQRKTVSASVSAIAASAKHKEAGTEMYKLGRYAEAETHYSSAIAALPDSHLLLVPLYNNRALTRIKTGDHSGAIEDCTTVVTIVGPSYNPAREAKITKEDEGSSVDLGDGLVKALRRRAEAYEGKEKWDAARQDWETIAGTEWAGKLRSEAVRGAGRCRRMTTANSDGPSTSSTAAPVPPRPKPRPQAKAVQQRGPTPPSEALNRVREANAAAEAEDQLRHELKDTIDARLLAWKGGKENNIRALIASLETVLWPELGWQKVGMHELVTPNQVKIRYTKAIAKLHPDKLNAGNTTLEQRMIANGVFGSLSDAWAAFKQ